MMNITIRLFASLRDTVGTGQVMLNLPEDTRLDAAVQQLVIRYPALAGQDAWWHFAVNQIHAETDTMLKDGDRIAIFPYMAGG